MSTEILQGLIITVIGMGLVFVVIVFFWWMMNVLVKLTTKTEQPTDPSQVDSKSDDLRVVELAGLEIRRRAAAAAVAVAMTITARRGQYDPDCEALIEQGERGRLSAWQNVHRGRQLGKQNMLRANQNTRWKEK